MHIELSSSFRAGLREVTGLIPLVVRYQDDGPAPINGLVARYTEEVLTSVLGLSAADVAALVESGVCR